MRPCLKITMVGLGALTLLANTQAIAKARPLSRYEEIPARNLFGLKSPEPGPQPTNPPVALPRLTLTGITTILGNKLALLKEIPVAGNPGATATERSLVLAQGQREGDVEVLQIDENAKTVWVNNSGIPMALTFDRDGVKPQGTPGTPATTSPATSTAPGIPAPAPPSVANPTAGMHPLPSRNLRSTRVGVNPYAPVPATAPVQNIPPVAPPPTTTSPTITPPTTTPSSTPPLPPDLTPEEQAIVLELRRQAEKNNSTVPPVSTSTPSVPSTFLPGTSPAGNTPLLPQ